MKRWLAIAIVLAGSGCGKAADPGPSCGKVVDHMLDIMKSTAGGHGGMNLGGRQQMLNTCEARHMPKATRECLVNSKDITGLANCSRVNAPAPMAHGSGELEPHELGAPPLPTPSPGPASAGSGTPPP
jgi:hypothetical protein